MANHTYQLTEIVGTSTVGIDQAITNGIEATARTLRRVDWFEVMSIRGNVESGTVQHFQVEMKVGSRMEDPAS